MGKQDQIFVRKQRESKNRVRKLEDAALINYLENQKEACNRKISSRNHPFLKNCKTGEKILD